MSRRSVLFAAAGLVVLGALGIRLSADRQARASAAPLPSLSALATSADPSPSQRGAVATNEPRVPPSRQATATPGSEPGSDPKPAAEDAGAHPPRTTETLLTALGSKDDFVVVDAADDLIERKETRALPILLAFDIKDRPHAAPTVIDALGTLGGADPAARRSATDRLLELLAQEKARGARESAGNVLVLYSALGKTLDPRAAPALEADLLDPQVTLAAKTTIVEALVQLRQRSSLAALRTAMDQLERIVLDDALEDETRRELLAAIARAIRILA